MRRNSPAGSRVSIVVRMIYRQRPGSTARAPAPRANPWGAHSSYSESRVCDHRQRPSASLGASATGQARESGVPTLAGPVLQLSVPPPEARPFVRAGYLGGFGKQVENENLFTVSGLSRST